MVGSPVSWISTGGSCASGRERLCDDVIDAAAGVVVGGADVAAGRIVIDAGHGDDDDRLGDVVEHDHAVVERERQVGQVAIVGRGVGQVLGVANDVVAGVADRAAEVNGGSSGSRADAERARHGA